MIFEKKDCKFAFLYIKTFAFLLHLTKNIAFIPTLLLLFISIEVASQQYNYRNYTTKDGLPSSEIYHAIQDSQGYIWLATDDGVSRFDGVNFINFGLNEGLVNNVVFDLYEDDKGRIWMVSFSGQLCYYKNGRIFPYQYNNEIKEFLEEQCVPAKKSLYVDSVENIYLSIEYVGVIKIDAKGNVSNLMSPSKKNLVEIIKITKDKKLIGHQYKRSKDTELLIDGNRYKFEYSVFRSSILFLLEDNKNNDLIAVKHGIYKHSPNNYTRISKNEDIVLWFSKDKKGRYWLSTFEHGVKCFYDEKFANTPIYHFLEHKNITSVLVDNENGYWFTTLNNGLYYLPYAEINSLIVESEKSKNILSVTAYKNQVYCGLQDKTFRIYDSSLKKEIYKRKFHPGETPKKLVYNKADSELLIGTYSYCYHYNEKTDKYIKHEKLLASKSDSNFLGMSINDIYLENNNVQWYGTNIGLFKYKNKENTYRSDIANNWNKTVLAIEKADSQSLWLGTFEGLWKHENGKFTYLGSQNVLLKARINSIIQNGNKLYLATSGYGIVVYDINKKTVDQYSLIDGLASNSVTCLKNFNKKLYIATNKGLNIVDLKEKKWSDILKLDENSGLLSNDINDIHIEDGVLYIASKKGLNRINTNSINFNRKAPEVYIEKIEVNGKDTSCCKTLNLDYYQNNISISLVAISYKNAGNTIFKYKLEPIDNNWKETNSNKINFSNLQPGNYVFRVKCKNENNVWSNTKSDISFNINKPFWKEWWFITLPFVLLGLITTLFLQRKLSQLRKENELRKELKTYFYKTLSTQLNPHFVFNSLNSLNKFILKEDKLNASLFLAKISNYLRAVFDTIQGEFISLQNELGILDIYLKLEKERLKDKLDFQIVLDDNIDASKITLPALIFVPLVEKAVWTRLNNVKKSGFVKISISQIDNSIEIAIEDNGIVIDNNDEVNIGTNIHKRVELLNKLYKNEVSFKFIKNTKVSFDDIGNVVKLRLKPSND